MKHLLFITFLLCSFVPNMSIAQSTKMVNITYSAEDFTLVSSGRGMDIHSPKYMLSCGSDTLTPAIPTISVTVPLDEGMDFNGFEYTTSSQLLLQENVVLNANKLLRPTSMMDEPVERNISYPMGIYPNENVRQTGTYVLRGQKFVCFLVSPFRYDAYSKNLYLIASVTLQIQQKGGQAKDGDWHRSGNRSQNNTNTTDYEYVIITNDTLKPAFDKLAYWKTMKGVRTKVLTTDSIYNKYRDSLDIDVELNPQHAIKKELRNYYDGQYTGLEYVLLGGDVEIVPSQTCYIHMPNTNIPRYDTVATDWYYSCLETLNWDSNRNGLVGETADIINLAGELIVSRLPVRNCEEAHMMVDRIIEYERNPPLDNLGKKMLLCGNKLHRNELYYLYPDSISDAQYYGEELIYYINSEQWDGQIYRLFDTGTNFSGGASYNFNVENLQTELSKGYIIANIDTHGTDSTYVMENLPDYNIDNATTIENGGYTAIITVSCLTNAFDKFSNGQPITCLSEAFMRNPNSGIITYIGSSREGWQNTSFDYQEALYQYFFSNNFGNSYRQLGRALRDAKNSQLSYCNEYINAYRWLLFSINMLGDPEMPLYTSPPQQFDNIIIDNFHDDYIDIYAGDSNATIHIMSKNDMGESFYEHHQESVVLRTGFNIDRTICITEPGYIPYMASFGNNTYIQNETIIFNQDVFSDRTFIGKDVTNQRPQGPVTLERGKLIINSPQVTIMNCFEVKKGAEFEINVNN